MQKIKQDVLKSAVKIFVIMHALLTLQQLCWWKAITTYTTHINLNDSDNGVSPSVDYCVLASEPKASQVQTWLRSMEFKDDKNP